MLEGYVRRMRGQQTFRTAQAGEKYFELDDIRLNSASLASLPHRYFYVATVPECRILTPVAKKCAREERTLKPCSEVSSVLKEGTNYGKEYDDRFCDHMGGREWFIKLRDVVHRGNTTNHPDTSSVVHA